MRSFNLFAVRILFFLTAMLITEGEQAFASDPLPYFQRLELAQDTTMGILVCD